MQLVAAKQEMSIVPGTLKMRGTGFCDIQASCQAAMHDILRKVCSRKAEAQQQKRRKLTLKF